MSRLEVHLRVARGRRSVEIQARCDRWPLVLLGPSGAGKTTVLECIAGLVQPAAGTIRWDTRTLVDTGSGVVVPARQRGLGYVMQDGALFPHLTVRDNLRFAARAAGDRRRVAPDVETLLDLFELRDLAERRPHEISGGQRARTALARALAAGPELLLLDEPFTGLDPAARDAIRSRLFTYTERHQLPALLVTHDRDEALAFGRHAWLMFAGRGVQEGAPAALLRRPPSAAAACFLGVDNVWAGHVLPRRDTACRIACPPHTLHVQPAGELPAPEPGTLVYVCVRSEDIVLTTEPQPHTSARNQIAATVRALEPHERLSRVVLDAAGLEVRALVTRDAVDELGLRPDRRVWASFKAVAAHLLPRPATPEKPAPPA